ncbi:MAG: response regulator [Verrucomicrobiota bacterium]
METSAVTPRKRQIVIVDDNADLAWFFAEILKLHGYEALVFADPVAALKHVLSQTTDAVICDLQMPQLDGDLLYATVERSKPELVRRFLFVTAAADEARYQHFLGTVEAPVLLKPVAVESLLAEIERLTR